MLARRESTEHDSRKARANRLNANFHLALAGEAGAGRDRSGSGKSGKSRERDEARARAGRDTLFRRLVLSIGDVTWSLRMQLGFSRVWVSLRGRMGIYCMCMYVWVYIMFGKRDNVHTFTPTHTHTHTVHSSLSVCMYAQHILSYSSLILMCAYIYLFAYVWRALCDE